MAITCQKAGCGQPATHALQIGVGTYTDPEEAPPRCKVLLGILLCAACLDDETAEKWLELNPALAQILTISMSGGPPPDLDRAVVLGVALDSLEYRDLQIAQMNHARN